MVTSIVAFAVITDASGFSKTNYIIFVGALRAALRMARGCLLPARPTPLTRALQA